MTYSIIGILSSILLLITNRDILWKHDRGRLTKPVEPEILFETLEKLIDA